MSQGSPILVDTAEDLEALASRLVGVREIALDFEGDYNLHRYGMHLCLIQLSDGKECWLVDTVRLGSVEALSPLLSSRETIKVMYAADEDVKLLKHAQGFAIAGLFDVQAAARMLRYEETSLSALVKRFAGVELEKHEKLQRSDWSKRPMTPDQMEYAADDVRHLLPIRDAVLEDLGRAGLSGRAEEKFRSLEERVFHDDPRPYLRIKGSGAHKGNNRVALKYLFFARDEVARRLDWPPYRVLANGRLLDLARRDPTQGWESSGELPRAVQPYADLFVFAVRLAAQEIREIEAGPPAQPRSRR